MKWLLRIYCMFAQHVIGWEGFVFLTKDGVNQVSCCERCGKQVISNLSVNHGGL